MKTSLQSKLQNQSRRQSRLSNVLAGTILAILCFAPRAFAAIDYLDLNDVSPGFDSGPGTYTVDLTTTANWTTDNTGVNAPVLFTAVAGNGIQIGGVPSDFSGESITVNMSDAASIGNNPATFNIVSTNATVTMSGTANCRYNHATTWTVAAGSTLIVTSTGNNNGFNFNSETYTLTGGGIMNFQSAFAANDNAAGGITEDMTNGTVQLNQTKTSNFGNTATAAGFILKTGTLQFGSATALADTFQAFIAGTAKFTIGANSPTIDNTSGSDGTIALGAGTYSIGGNFTFTGSSGLSFGPNSVALTGNPKITVSANSLTFGGVVSGSGFGITKAGAGTLALTGANTYNGSTIVSAGKLITTTASIGGGKYVVTNGSALDVQVAAAGQTLNVTNLTLGASGADSCSLQIDAGALGDPTVPVINATNLVVNGAVTINLLGTALVPGTYTILTNAPGARTGGGSFTLSTSPRISATLNNDTANNRVTVTITALPDTGIVWNGGTAGNWDINDGGNNIWKGNGSGLPTYYLESATFGDDSVRFDDSATGTTNVNLTTTLSPAGITVSNTTAMPTADYIFTGGGSLDGTAGLTKQGSGTLTLAESGGDNFSGGITVNGGTLLLDDANSALAGNTTLASGTLLQVGNNDSNGSLPGTVANNGSLVFDRSDSVLNVAGIIAGVGSLTNNGVGTVTLSAVETYTGPTVVNAGILALAAGNHSPSTLSSSSGLTINNGGTVQVNIDNSLAGSGGTLGILPVIINAGGILTGLGTADSGAGTSSHIRGLLTLNGGTLAMGGTQINTQYGTWDLDDGLAVNGGTTTSTISALNVIPDQAGGTLFNVAAGGTTSGIDLNVTGSLINGTSAHDTGIIKMGGGTMALAGANTYTGNTIINAGTLSLTGSGSLYSSVIDVTNGATFDVSQLSSPFTLNPYQTLGGNGVVTGNVQTMGYSLVDAGLYGGSTLTFSNNLKLSYGDTNQFVLDTISIGANSLIAVVGTLDISGGFSSGGIVIQVNYTTLHSGRYKLFTYGSLTGSIADLSLQGYIASGRQTAALDNSIPGEIDLVVTGEPVNLTWLGDGVNNYWDTKTTSDWSNTVSHVSDIFYAGDLVTFDDTGSQSPAVNLTGTVQPTSIRVANNSGTYTFGDLNYMGKISGPTELVKQGSGTLALTESGGDDFTGGILVGGGSLLLSNNNVNISGGVTITNGSVTVAHSGTISGGLTMDNSAGGSPSAQIVGYGTLNGDVTVEGNLAISNTPTINGNLVVNSGNTLLDEDTIPTGNATIASGATVRVGNNDYSGNLPSGTTTMNGTLVFNFNQYDYATVSKVIAGSSTGTLIKTNMNLVTLSAANTFTGAVSVVQGTLLAGNAAALGKTNIGTTISSGATLDVNGYALGGEPITVSGIGMTNVDGSTNGAINNSSSTQVIPALNFITMTGDTIFGTTVGRWDLGSPAGPTGDPAASRLDTGGHPYKLTKVGGQFFGLRSVTVDPQLGDVDVQAGTFNIEGNTTGLGNSSSNLFVRFGATLEFYNMTNQLNKQIKLDDGATVLNGAGTNIVIGPVTLAGTSDTFNVGGASLTLNGQLGGAGALTKTGTGTLILTAPGNNYSGDTTVSAGTLALAGSGNLPSIGQIMLTAANLDVSQESGQFTLTKNSLTASGGSTLIATNSAPASIGTFNMDDSTLQLPVANASAASVIVTNLILGGSTNYVTVTVVGTPSQTEFPLVKFVGLTGFNIGVANILPAAAGYIGYITNNVSNLSIDFVLTGSGASIVWDGGNSAVDNNWSDALNWSGVALQPGNNLFFTGTAALTNTNDTTAGNPYSGINFNSGAGAFILKGNPVTLTGNITNNSVNPQTINIPMSIAQNMTVNAGTAGVTLAGGITNTSATLATIHLQGTNGIIAGPLQSSADGLQNNLEVTLDSVGVSNIWSVVGNNTSYLTNLNVINGSITIGTGADSPALFVTNNSGGDIIDLGNVASGTGVLNVNSGTVSLTGTKYVQLGNAAGATGIINESGGTLIVASAGGIDTGNLTGTFGIINITGGTFDTSGGGYSIALRGTGTLNISGTGLVRVNTLTMARNNADSPGAAGTINLNAGGTLQINHESMGNAATGQTGTINFNGGVLLATANSASFMSPAASPTVFTATVKAGGAIINDGGFAITNSAPLVHDTTLGGTADGGLVKTGSGTLALSGANTYTGNTVVSNGTLEVDGSLAAGAVTVTTNGTLSGIGTIGGTVTVNGTVAPGSPSAIGTLTCSANATLNDTNLMKLDETVSPSNDLLSVTGTLTYGGALNVTSGSTFTAGDSFRLFTATTYHGSFSATNLPSLNSGLSWNWNPASGTLSVVPSVNTNPTNIIATVSGNVLQLSWPADHTGWRLLVQTNHLAAGISLNTNDWTTVPGSAGIDQTNIMINPLQPAEFYRLVYP